MEPTPGIDPSAAPSGEGCLECDGVGGWWLHLRRCAQCGHVGCCDSSPEQHASKHAAQTGHRYIQSYEPGEDWFWDYQAQDYYGGGPSLAEPRHHPVAQTVPGPRERVPADWQDHLH